MMLDSPVVALAVALAAGALIGAEREQSKSTSDIGGIRTYPLLALLGALAGVLRPLVGGWIIAATLVAVGAMMVASHFRVRDPQAGMTSEAAALTTCVLGVMAGTPEFLTAGERYLLVAGAASIVMALLALKQPLHGFISRMSREDIYATVKFVVLALVLLPLLPDEDFDPLAALNPFNIGLMVVLVASASFVGYILARALGGGRGYILTGLVGGLVSSTAVALTFAGRARANPTIVRLAAAAIVVASSIMFARMLVLVASTSPSLLAVTAWPLGAMAVTGVLATLVLYRRDGKTSTVADAVPLENPFALRKALGFGLLYGVIKLVAKAAEVYVGDAGVLVSSVIAGFTDVDAITLSVTELHRNGLARDTAMVALILAAASNTLFKAGLALIIGGRALGWRVGLCFLIVLLVGVASVAFMWLASAV